MTNNGSAREVYPLVLSDEPERRQTLPNGSVTMEIVITPLMAGELMRLAAVKYVRSRLNGIRVATYARHMLAQTWRYTLVDPIPVTRDGYLINGLNRLAAIQLSGVPQKMSIVLLPETAAESESPVNAWHLGPRMVDAA